MTFWENARCSPKCKLDWDQINETEGVVGKSMSSKAVISRSVVSMSVSSRAVQVGSKLEIGASVCSTCSTVVKYSVFSNHVVGR